MTTQAMVLLRERHPSGLLGSSPPPSENPEVGSRVLIRAENFSGMIKAPG